MRKKTLATFAAGVAIVGITLSGCSSNGGSTSTSTSNGSSSSTVTDLKIGDMLDVTSWDPSKADIGFDGPYLSAVYDPLIALDKDGNPVPALADKWTESTDGMTYTLDIHTGTKFSDGEVVDAAAVVDSLNYLKKGATSSEAYTNVKDFVAVNDSTVRIDMTKPDGEMLYLMGLGRSYVMAPKSIAAGTLAKDPIGSGPYTLNQKTSVAGSQYNFTKVSGYWDAKLYPWKTVSVFPIVDATARNNAMLSGQINVQYGAAENPQAKQQGWNTAERVSGWVGLQFTDHTGAKFAPLGKVQVRQALNYAFDDASILKAIGQDAGALTNQVWPSGNAGNMSSLNNTYSYNVAKAKQLMSEAGYANGFSVHMPVSPQFQPWQASTTQALAAIGVTVTWDSMQQADYQVKAANYPMYVAFLSMDGSDVATMYRQVVSPEWYNATPDYSKFPQLVTDVNKVESTSGSAQAQAIQTLNTDLTNLAWWSVWYQADNIYYSAKGIKVQPIVGMMFPTLRYITQG